MPMTKGRTSRKLDVTARQYFAASHMIKMLRITAVSRRC